MRKIIHVDMDAFYASVEQRDDPSLKGKPLAVGYAGKRGVVAAASYEARKFGVRSAMASSTALRKCPQLIFRPARFEVYRAISKQIRQIFADYTELIEPLSLDEAYLDVTENLRGLPTANATAKEIRRRIFEETGLTASAGISYNKFLAKIASDFRKPNGQFVILPEQGEAFVETLPVEKFHGIGPVTAEKMKRLGIHTGADLKSRSREYLQKNFGKSGAWYYEIARAQDDRPVEPHRIRKSYSSENTHSEDLTTPAAVEEAALAMAEDVWNWCDQTENYGRTVTVKIKYADFKLITRRKSALTPIQSHELFRKVTLELVRSVFPLRTGVRLVGVGISSFEEKKSDEPAQLTMGIFGDE